MNRDSEFFTQALAPRLKSMEDADVRTLIQELLEHTSVAEASANSVDPPTKPKKKKPIGSKPGNEKNAAYYESLLDVPNLEKEDSELAKIIKELIEYTKECESNSH